MKIFNRKNKIPDEATLLAELKKGNERAFRQIYDHYAPACYRVATRQLQSEAMAAEVIQKTFTEVWSKRMEIKNVMEFIFRTAQKTALDRLKQYAREYVVENDISTSQQQPETTGN